MEAKDITPEQMREMFPERSGQHSVHREPAEAGAADYYYHRDAAPSFAVHGRTYTESEMTDWQIADYCDGYADAEAVGDKKVW